jgi:ATP-dependent protease Clp ATPase subunit
MNYENLANVGDVIKSYDFQCLDDHIIGIVTAKNACHYEVKVLESVTESEEFNKLRFATTVTVPFKAIFEYEGRLELVATLDELSADELFGEVA